MKPILNRHYLPPTSAQSPGRRGSSIVNLVEDFAGFLQPLWKVAMISAIGLRQVRESVGTQPYESTAIRRAMPEGVLAICRAS
jgi:hypothetical protein